MQDIAVGLGTKNLVTVPWAMSMLYLVHFARGEGGKKGAQN
jgi:hypothetical protein